MKNESILSVDGGLNDRDFCMVFTLNVKEQYKCPQ
jgi:hypothetical protein